MAFLLSLILFVRHIVIPPSSPRLPLVAGVARGRVTKAQVLFFISRDVLYVALLVNCALSIKLRCVLFN